MFWNNKNNNYDEEAAPAARGSEPPCHGAVIGPLLPCLLYFFGGLSADVFVQDLNVIPLTSIIIHDINFLREEGIRRKLIKTETRSDFSK